jgi:hypothetical protein
VSQRNSNAGGHPGRRDQYRDRPVNYPDTKRTPQQIAVASAISAATIFAGRQTQETFTILCERLAHLKAQGVFK